LSYNTYVHGNVIRKIPAELPETNKNAFPPQKKSPREQEGKTGLDLELVLVGEWKI
jgi:hypothetical protein